MAKEKKAKEQGTDTSEVKEDKPQESLAKKVIKELSKDGAEGKAGQKKSALPNSQSGAPSSPFMK